MPIMTASQVLKTYWTPNRFPVDPVIIARNAGLRVEILPPDSRDSGHYTPAQNNVPALIEYSNQEHIVRQRFTVAHELGHYFLGHSEAKRENAETFGNGYDPQEVLANRFAANLLMPANEVERYLAAKGATLARLAATFGVSERAMNFRLINLGLINV